MKIKTQLNIFKLGVIFVPLLCAIVLPLYYFMTRPDRIFTDDYKKIRKAVVHPVSAQDEKKIISLLKNLPRGVDFILIGDDDKILFTNIPELKTNPSYSKMEIISFLDDTMDKYFYQIVAPPLADKESKITLVTRVSRDKKHSKPNWQRLIILIILAYIIFETFNIIVILQLSRTISKSITFLDQNTKKISGGELDVQFEHQKYKSNEITSLMENIDKMRLALKDNDERRSRFIMGISHDLRTPVAVIKGYTEAMADGMYTAPDEIKNSLEIISSKTNQLETMINTLINFVKLNQTDWIQQLKPQKLKPFIQEFGQTSVTTGEIFKRKVEFSSNISDDFETPMDTLLAQRALENIFSNAIRYTNENDIIKIAAIQDGQTVQLKIIDTGIGIEQKNIKRIFDMFFRGTNSRRESGIGIGLSVVKTIIESHNWKIDAKSEIGKGSEFTITIDNAQQQTE